MSIKSSKYFLTLKIKYLSSYFLWLLLYILQYYLIMYILNLDQVHINLFSVTSSTYIAVLCTFALDIMMFPNSIYIKAMRFPDSIHIQAVSIRN